MQNFETLIQEGLTNGTVNVTFNRVDGSETTRTVTDIIEQTSDRYIVNTTTGTASFYTSNIVSVG